MKSFPSNINSTHYKQHINETVLNMYLESLRKDICIFLFKSNLQTQYYNFSDFFLKHKIDDDNLKQSLKDTIIFELKELKWCLAYVFNKTGLVICENEEQMGKNIWKTNLTFTYLMFRIHGLVGQVALRIRKRETSMLWESAEFFSVWMEKRVKRFGLIRFTKNLDFSARTEGARTFPYSSMSL